MRVAVIGLGSIGRRHARVLAARAEVELVLCERNPELLEAARAEVGGVLACTDITEALQSGVTAAVVCTPNHLHGAHAVAALEAGCDVLLEKPLAHTNEDAARIRAAARRTGRRLQVGYILRFWPGLAEVRDLAAAGAIGRVVAARVVVGAYETLDLARSDYRRSSAAGGGCILDYSHELDYLRLLLGDVRQVSCFAGSVGGRLAPVPGERPAEDLAAISLAFRSGAIGTVHIDYIQRPGRRILELIGLEGRLELTFGALTRLRHLAADGSETEHTWPVDRDEAFRLQWEAFQAGAGNRLPPADAPDGAAVLAIALAALESAHSGRIITLGEGGTD